MWELVSTWDRAGATERASGPGSAARIVRAVGPVAARHGMGPAQPSGESALWCSPADELRVVDQVERHLGQPLLCTDLVVHVDPQRCTIAVDLEGHGLAEQLTGRSHWSGPIAVALADDLGAALAIVADHVDRLCSAVLVHGPLASDG